MDALPLPSPETTTTTRDWSELPVDALSVVFAELGAVEILMGAGLVCRPWLDAAKLPHLWRRVDMAHHDVVTLKDRDAMCRAMAKLAVDRSGGRLEVFEAKGFVDDELLKYIGDRSPCLKGLHLESCFNISKMGITQLITMSPLLEGLVLRGVCWFC